MPFMPLRDANPAEEAVKAYDAWIEGLEEELAKPDLDRSQFCLSVLRDIYFPGLDGLDLDELSAAQRMWMLNLDPRNITMEPEYYIEVDQEEYARVKPLLWLWQMFDKSPLGNNVHLGVRFRRMLAPHIFRRCGRNFKCFNFVEFSFGYNMEVGDDVVVHRHVLLDDRGGISLGDRVSISDYANIYSHTHSIVDQRNVTLARTVLEDDVRITYHATVLAGVTVGRNSMVGANAVATRDVRPFHVNVGIPAKSVRVKPSAPPDVSETTTVERLPH
ncbi:MAG: acyltransferase [Gemmatimonadetes bacterium]|uniref:Acyltransferase n=1 Tax=Candidatus Kutchimonas denitrificans TaxID=3056748 RepID=A0AAE4Z835_9BACT|nr:acyltransferase [Gemmatimonadota bacterium]NIR75549.1 acyltransferase [Candidatus Kutchimonas denitrificans]NIS01863.1 acyltransferase [Gemmatimonadota bacterium]NIT67644.1 acyltransferase [Gemmatimonadota bacterium]NIU53518.1 acyltransferase [Gemmatimonadota bacterium]